MSLKCTHENQITQNTDMHAGRIEIERKRETGK